MFRPLVVVRMKVGLELVLALVRCRIEEREIECSRA